MVHIGVIPDGNRRWCEREGRNHKRLKDEWLGKLCEIVRDYPDSPPERWKNIGHITELTLYVCSVDNVERDDDTMDTIYDFLDEALPVAEEWYNHLVEGVVQVNVVGDIDRLRESTRALLRRVMCLYQAKDPLFTVNVAVAYDYETDCQNHGHFTNPAYDTRRMSQMDVVLRTGGDQRLSGFFPTKTYYAEFFFLKKYWPELDLDDVHNVIGEFMKRTRRFGS